MFSGSVANHANTPSPGSMPSADKQYQAPQGAVAKIAQVSSSASVPAPGGSNSMLQFAALKNGAEVPLVSIRMTMKILKEFSDVAGSVALFELNEKCKKPQHQMYGTTASSAEQYGLTEGGKVLDATRNIILSSIEGEGLDLRLNNPIAYFTGNK